MRIRNCLSTLPALILICMVTILSVPASAAGKTEKLTVVTTLFPLFDWAGIIGGEQAEVTLLLPPGIESHSFDPRPQDVVRINKSDMFIYTGKYMEPWAGDLLKGTVNKDLLVIDGSQGIELMDERHSDGHPFEWVGAFKLEKGQYTYAMKAGPDPSMKLVILRIDTASSDGIEAVEEKAAEIFAGKEESVLPGGQIEPGQVLYGLELTDKATLFTVAIGESGAYALFTEHMPEEFHSELLRDSKVINALVSESAEPHGHDEHHSHGGKDPHIWLDFNNAEKMVDTIADGFIARDPGNKELYETRAKEYKTRLQELDGRYKKALSQCKRRTIIYGGHFAFGYFTERFNLEHVSPYKGFAPNAEPTPRDIAELTKRMKEGGFKYIFYEEGIDPKVARVIGEETGAGKLLLHGAHNVSKDELSAKVSYYSLMNDNLARLQEGLECR